MFATHRVEEADAVADRVVVIAGGQSDACARGALAGVAQRAAASQQ
jgi:ABC-type Na+ transport system ATPase subunit NatA